jgi:hypothetical protein
MATYSVMNLKVTSHSLKSLQDTYSAWCVCDWDERCAQGLPDGSVVGFSEQGLLGHHLGVIQKEG